MTPRRMRNDKTVTPRRMQHHNRLESLRYRAGAVCGAVLSHCTISQVRPAHGRTGVSPLHTLHSSPLDTPRQHARVLPRRRSKPPTAPRATKSLWTRPPRGLGAVAPAPRLRSNSPHPDAHHPRPASPRPLTPQPPPRAPNRRGRARTPLAQPPRTPKCTPPATTRPEKGCLFINTTNSTTKSFCTNFQPPSYWSQKKSVQPSPPPPRAQLCKRSCSNKHTPNTHPPAI